MTKPKLTPAQLETVAAEKAAFDWWSTEGRYIDPDTEDVDWYDKRGELAQMAFLAGRKSVIALSGKDRT